MDVDEIEECLKKKNKKNKKKRKKNDLELLIKEKGNNNLYIFLT